MRIVPLADARGSGNRRHAGDETPPTKSYQNAGEFVNQMCLRARAISASVSPLHFSCIRHLCPDTSPFWFEITKADIVLRFA